MRLTPRPIPAKVADLLQYDAESGVISWKRLYRGRRPGQPTGWIDADGYVIVKVGGVGYLGHRVAWFLHTGEQPPDLVDHKDLNPGNNRWENIRAASVSQNAANIRGGRHGLPKGTTYLARVGKYQAQLRHHGEVHYLGLHATADDAHAAYMAAANRLHGEFARGK